MTDVDVEPELNARIDREVLAAGEPQQREAQRRPARARSTSSPTCGSRCSTAPAEIVAVAGIDIDITAQKRNEAELAELLRRVEMARDAAMEAASAKSRFLASMSHELRTPLNAIIGFTRLVSRNADGLPDEAGRQPLQDPHQRRAPAGADRRDPRPLADRGRRGPRRHRRDATSPTCCERSPSRSSRWSTVRACSWSSRPTRACHAVVTDRDKVKQILLNLLSNAIKYTDDGSIAVRAEAVGRAASGRACPTPASGSRATSSARIFDEFHRADSASARRRRGTGLGPDDLAAARAGARRRHHRREPARRRIDLHARPAADTSTSERGAAITGGPREEDGC